MKRRIHTAETQAAAIADLYASGDTVKDVAERHGVGRSTLSKWVAKDEQRGIAYSGGWENVGGVMRPLFPERRSA